MSQEKEPLNHLVLVPKSNNRSEMPTAHMKAQMPSVLP
jgi:hypothetical protein